ncbi:MAG: nitroreductase family protein [Planctomycetota bacterium]|jgi:nitroreductase
MDLEQAITTRRSIKTYDPDYELTDETLRGIFELVQKTPTSFNVQNVRFVVVRDPGKREELKAACYGQKHVAAAHACVIAAGKLDFIEDIEPSQMHAPEEVRRKLVPMITGIYNGNDQLCRDEAIRTASLASMTLMLVARAKGLDTCPMIGFDPKKVSAIVGLGDGYVPAMLITLGKRGDGDVFPTSRFEVSETVRLETLDGPGLA